MPLFAFHWFEAFGDSEFRGVEPNVMLISHADDSVRLSLFPYFFEQPQILPFTFLNVFFYILARSDTFPFFLIISC